MHTGGENENTSISETIFGQAAAPAEPADAGRGAVCPITGHVRDAAHGQGYQYLHRRLKSAAIGPNQAGHVFHRLASRARQGAVALEWQRSRNLVNKTHF